MSVIQWDSSLEIGHVKIDEQHKALVEIINRLHAASGGTSGQCDFKPTMMELYKYTMCHFMEEESLMSKASYPLRPMHKLEHDKFVQQLDILAEKAKAGGCIGTETFTWLVGWLLDHISVTDKKLVDCLKNG